MVVKPVKDPENCLGYSQRGEVAYLKQFGIPFETITTEDLLFRRLKDFY